MSYFKIIISFILVITCTSLNSQPDLSHLPKLSLPIRGYQELQTGSRTSLIHLDSIIISNVIHTMINKGCSSLDFFLRSFHGESDFSMYPTGFNFSKFNSGFGNTLKKEICKELVKENICLEEIISNIFAPGNLSSELIHSYPVFELIFIDKDPIIIASLKKILASEGYRINYNSNFRVDPVIKKLVNRKWITLFNDEELKLIGEEQLVYLQRLS